MVVFTCNGCGDMLKKNQVDAHAYKCRRCESVSCIDCLVKFYGDDYRSHTSCVTEVERYEKKGTNANNNPNSKKPPKQTPQQQWMDLIQHSIAQAPSPALASCLEQIAQLDNVPRKEKQFRNFTQNSLRHVPPAIVESVWKFLSQQRQEQQQTKKAEQLQVEKEEKEKGKWTSQQRQETTEVADTKMQQQSDNKDDDDHENDNDNDDTEQEKTKAAHSTSTTADDTNTTEFRPKPKMVHKAVRKVLRKAPSQSMKLKELRVAVQQMLQAKLEMKKDANQSSSSSPLLTSQKEWKRLLKTLLKEANDVQVDGKLVTLKV